MRKHSGTVIIQTLVLLLLFVTLTTLVGCGNRDRNRAKDMWEQYTGYRPTNGEVDQFMNDHPDIDSLSDLRDYLEE